MGRRVAQALARLSGQTRHPRHGSAAHDAQEGPPKPPLATLGGPFKIGQNRAPPDSIPGPNRDPHSGLATDPFWASGLLSVPNFGVRFCSDSGFPGGLAAGFLWGQDSGSRAL